MIFRNRALAYAGTGVAGILAAGLFAAPAVAAEPADLAIEATGTTIAVGAPGKTATVSLLNKSKVDATKVLVGLDISKLDTTKVDIDENGCSPREDGLILCGIEGDVLRAGADIDWAFPLTRKNGSVGDAGEISAIILHDGEDPDESNNEVTVKVKVEGTGADLTVVAPDIDREISDKDALESDTPKGSPLNPGDDTVAVAYVENQGDRPVATIKVEMLLPKGVTFGSIRTEECGFSSDRRKFTCSADVELAPKAWLEVVLPVTVAKGVKAPATLTGGTVTVESLGEAVAAGDTAKATKELPSFLRKVTRSGPQKRSEVDASDNTDGFGVMVTPLAGGSGGGNGDNGGGLPVTGPQAGLIGGVGAVVLAAGAAMFIVSRRRRVLLVTPGDEKSTN
ncbi:hypothetical protein [Micromonospora auratinigra]|uniref:LPXTG-motif cell wall anchor domain-containing protein n=1 Tax=Micromonospora auratinigra TaxID=261654 RepID=A0A1A9A3K2_9ACTN|nr:hypothetical protein [Micromonospora auratinigra]SBT50778.1 hypothetical protein GA0070611_4898 [Micromonospora auratinigra]